MMVKLLFYRSYYIVLDVVEGFFSFYKWKFVVVILVSLKIIVYFIFLNVRVFVFIFLRKVVRLLEFFRYNMGVVVILKSDDKKCFLSCVMRN